MQVQVLDVHGGLRACQCLPDDVVEEGFIGERGDPAVTRTSCRFRRGRC
jgi:hypothetical protein